MDANAHERLMALIEDEDQLFQESIIRMLKSVPILATGELHDPYLPVYHPMTSSSGFPPLSVMFSPADGFHVLVFEDLDSIPRPINRPLSECYHNPNDMPSASRTAHSTGAHRNPAHAHAAEMIPASTCRPPAKR